MACVRPLVPLVLSHAQIDVDLSVHESYSALWVIVSSNLSCMTGTLLHSYTCVAVRLYTCVVVRLYTCFVVRLSTSAMVSLYTCVMY